MPNLKSIMKTLIPSLAIFLLLRASTSAYLSNHAHAINHEQLVHQPAQYQELVKNLASSEDFVEIEPDDTYKHKSNVASFDDDEDQNEDAESNLASQTSRLISTPSPQKKQFKVGSTGLQWAMVYHPYNADGSCRTRAVVHSNLATIASKGFTSIRLHNHDCSILPKLASSPMVASQKIRLILGIHIDEEGLSAAEPHVADILAWGISRPLPTSDNGGSRHASRPPHTHWGMVELIVVGEESIFNTHTTAPKLGAFISKTRAALRSAGYKGPVTTTEPIHVLYDSGKDLCPHLDILASNIHPFFHADVSAATAGSFVEDTLSLLESVVCSPDSDSDSYDVDGDESGSGTQKTMQAVNLETGWPWRGRPNGEAIPSREQQTVALEGILSRVGGRSVVLGFGDDAWMDEGEFGVEGSWGCEGLFPSKS